MQKTNKFKHFPVISRIADAISHSDKRLELRDIYPDFRVFKEALPPETEQERQLRLDQETWDEILAWDEANKQEDETLQLDLFDGEKLFRTSSTERIRGKHVTYLDWLDIQSWKLLMFNNTSEAFQKAQRRSKLIQENWDPKKHKTLSDVLKDLRRKGLL